MADAFTEARKRQLGRLGGAKPPAPRAAIALAKSQAYQDAADAPATLRAYATDLANYTAWCDRHGSPLSEIIHTTSFWHIDAVGGRPHQQ